MTVDNKVKEYLERASVIYPYQVQPPRDQVIEIAKMIQLEEHRGNIDTYSAAPCPGGSGADRGVLDNPDYGKGGAGKGGNGGDGNGRSNNN